MTEQNDNLDETEDGGGRGKSGLVKILALVGGMLLVAAISIGGTLFLTGAFSDEPEPVAEGEAGQRGSTGLPPRAHYLQLNPDFVITYEVGPRQRFLKVELAVMARDQQSLNTLTQHMPLVRDNIIQTLSDQTFSDIQRREGKEELMTALRDTMNRIVEEHSDAPGVEAVLYNNFVIQ
ncbi:MAG: flagellar basal body-associated FliL family protein [Natronospirillum sp.]|uniref:flagellar basal body-associated FliL family protein n=1 Tax=Natronospirillum sp. TaxID=2812955 RepID=UPI0025D97403|nr:flagellar basal body-associated FliL family protein [Natronospirillum sp.]MCH8551281.1 flagellar basal body-associated FliL family protein [Natronospirillum sp.]